MDVKICLLGCLYCLFVYVLYRKNQQFFKSEIEKRYVEMTSFDKDVNGQVKFGLWLQP